jgi:hypothetical protein
MADYSSNYLNKSALEALSLLTVKKSIVQATMAPLFE